MNDKTKHVIIGAIFGVLSLPLSLLIGMADSTVAMSVIATLVFLTKEWYDTIKPMPTGFDKMDLVADYLGLFAGFILTFFIWGLIQISKI